MAALAAALGETGAPLETNIPHHVALRRAVARRCISAHLWFYPGESLAPGWYYATVLRDPVDRFLSQYSFFRNHRPQVLSGTVTEPDVVAAVRLDLAQYVADPALRRSYTNMQAVHFAWRVCDAPDALDDRRLLDAAIASLEEYDLVGVFADLAGFLDRYCDALMVPRQSAPRLNVTADRTRVSGVSRSVLESLTRANEVDAALCRWAQERPTHRPPAARTTGRRAIGPRANFGNRRIEILASRCEGLASGSDTIARGEAVRVRVFCRAAGAVGALTAGIAVRDQDGTLAYGTNSNLLGVSLTVSRPCIVELSFVLQVRLMAGGYFVTIALHRGLSHLEGCYHWMEDAVRFVVDAREELNDTGAEAPGTPACRLEVSSSIEWTAALDAVPANRVATSARVSCLLRL